ncbi:MAG: translation initiation factor [Campylobacterota bacterium]|nr:translation initiation factor [Campylobacterota bacterium]
MFTMGANLEGDSWETHNPKDFDLLKKLKDPKKSFEKISKNEHQLVFTFEKRRGKPVTLVGRFFMNDKEKKEILKLLKTKLGCGGTVKDEWIEIQGDKKEKIIEVLEKDGWKFRKK